MKKNVFLLTLCTLVMTSCVIPKKVIYFKDMRPDILYAISQRPEVKIQPYDRLRIVITSKQPELTAPFNTGAGGYQVGQDGEVRSVVTNPAQERGFLVDRQGNIEFPVLGVIRVEGLTKQELSYQIKNQLRESRQINDAIVFVEILNFKITVIGEVANPGTQTVTDDKITIFEAIVKAGGVTTNGMMGDVLVMREDKRGMKTYVNDLRTVALFDSPTYFLQQNDYVYVLPKTARMSEREQRTWQWYNTILGLAGTVMSALLLMHYYK